MQHAYGMMETELDAPDRDDPAMILIIDSDSKSVQSMGQMLHQAGYRSTWTEDSLTGLALAEKYRPQAILLNYRHGDANAINICEELKGRLATCDTPVIFVTGAERTDELVGTCFEAGAHDVLTKPLNKVDLLGRIRVVLREQAVREAYRRLAIIDSVTGLVNRRQFFIHLMEAVMTSRRLSTESCLVLADIDGLSAINRQYGHDFGDEVILTFTRLIKRLVSPTCKAGRIGGEEFGIVFMDCPADRVMATARRLGQTFSAIAFDAGTEPKHFHAGFGVACYRGQPLQFDADMLMNNADVALFAAKEAGRGRVVGHWELDAASLPVVAPQKRHARTRARKKSQRSFLCATSEASRTNQRQ